MMPFYDLVGLGGRQLSRHVVESDGDLIGLDKQQWLLLVQTLASRLIAEGAEFSSNDWRVASNAVLRLFDLGEQAGAMDHGTSAVRQLNLLAALLARIPANDDVAVLSPQRMADLFNEAVSMTAAQARELTRDWRSQDISVIRQLRLVRNLLGPMLMTKKILVNAGLAEELAEWEQMLPLLP